jgi:hypothetical protein
MKKSQLKEMIKNSFLAEAENENEDLKKHYEGAIKDTEDHIADLKGNMEDFEKKLADLKKDKLSEASDEDMGHQDALDKASAAGSTEFMKEEEVDVNKILSNGGYDEIDDEELLATVKGRLKGNSNISAKKLNLLIMKIEDEEGGNIDFSEGKLREEEEVDVEDNEKVDVDIEKDVEVDDESVESDIEVKGSMPGENADEVAVQSLLMKAQEEAAKLGDEKLTDQIGNTITYFTRAHVAKVDADMSETLNEEVARFKKLAGIIK